MKVTEDPRRHENSSAIIVFAPPRGCTGGGSRHQEALDSHGFPPPRESRRDPDKVATASPCGQMPKAEVILHKTAVPSRSAASIALPHHFQLQALGSENLNRLKLLLCTAAVLARWARQKRGARRGVDLRRVRGLLTLSNFPPEALRSCRGAAVRPEARERRQRPGLPLAPPRLRPTPFSRV